MTDQSQNQCQPTRSIRSKKLRYYLWKSFDGKCAICGNEIDLNSFHVDHIVPWIVSKRTNFYECQPTCATCNLKKGRKHESE